MSTPSTTMDKQDTDQQEAPAKSWLDWSLIKVFYNPAAVFRAKISLQDGIIALILCVAAGIVIQYTDILALNLDLVLSEYVATLDVDPSEHAQLIESKKMGAYLAPLVVLVVFPVSMTILSVLFFLCGRALRAKASFKRIFTNVAVAYWPCLAAWAVWAALVHTIGIDNLRSGLDLAKIAPAFVPQWLTISVLDTIDVLNVWLVVLTVLGLAAAGFGKSRAVIAVGALWILYIAMKASLVVATSAPEVKKDCIMCKLKEEGKLD